jgi:hypothetical protein
MREIRRRFHEELRALEGDVQQTGTQAQRHCCIWPKGGAGE